MKISAILFAALTVTGLFAWQIPPSPGGTTPVVSPSSGPTVALAGSGSTNTNGAHSFAVAYGEKDCSITLNAVTGNYDTTQTYTNLINGTVPTPLTVTSNHDIAVSTLPVSTDPRVGYDCLYETQANTSSPFFLVAQIATGITTTTVALADSSFGAQINDFYQGASGAPLGSGTNETLCETVKGNLVACLDELQNSLHLVANEWWELENTNFLFETYNVSPAIVGTTGSIGGVPADGNGCWTGSVVITPGDDRPNVGNGTAQRSDGSVLNPYTYSKDVTVTNTVSLGSLVTVTLCAAIPTTPPPAVTYIVRLIP